MKLSVRSRFIAVRSPAAGDLAIGGHQAPGDLDSRDWLPGFGIDHSTGNGASLSRLGNGNVNIRALGSFADFDHLGFGFTCGVGVKSARVESPARGNPTD